MVVKEASTVSIASMIRRAEVVVSQFMPSSRPCMQPSQGRKIYKSAGRAMALPLGQCP